MNHHEPKSQHPNQLPSRKSKEGIGCVSDCEPEYPAALEGAEGSVGIKLSINSNGDVIDAELADANSNSQANRQKKNLGNWGIARSYSAAKHCDYGLRAFVEQVFDRI